MSFLVIAVASRDIENCHKLDKTNPKNIVVRFVNRTFCCQELVKNLDLHKLDSDRLGFNLNKTLYFSKKTNSIHSISSLEM